ncbi:AAA family ATPase [Kitasatospora sp. CMC57]|uniref:AAA family ATPase n=1 Tax=Kitasatospora sp. CMC57 TaxID=3231513 RepID=UPI0038B6300B
MEEVDLPPNLDGTERGLVVMMCGLPGSGKSTYARALEGRGYTRLSIDEVVWSRSAATRPTSTRRSTSNSSPPSSRSCGVS